jgi:methyl-accepting chemotaxis protein
MDSRTLFRLAAPLGLTLVLIVAESLGWPAGVKWGALVAMTLAWLAFAWIALHPVNREALREQSRLLDELRTFVTAEVQGSRAEIDRTRELIREAVAKLGGSFDVVNRKTREQSEVVARLLDRSGDERSGGMDVSRFAPVSRWSSWSTRSNPSAARAA